GTATIKNSNFGILRTNYSELEANDFVLIRAKEFNSDILKSTIFITNFNKIYKSIFEFKFNIIKIDIKNILVSYRIKTE
ncbi:hypothetical protein JG677_06860, partial [Campylobacter sp. TTU-622]|nr:hypothetical protein [Campylobacter sp. TTU-622]